MKKIIIVVLCLFVSGFSLIANPVGKEKAVEIARSFFRQSSPDKLKMAEFSNNRISKARDKNENTPFFIINNEDGGFVIVSNTTSTVPILAYSYNNTFDQEAVPENLQEWMEKVSAIIIERDIEPTPGITKVWKQYANRQFKVATPVVKLETAQWNQGAPFNNQCPEVDGERCVTGCVSTALAIVMRYWEWPNAGIGTLPKYSYSPEKGEGYDPDLGWIEGAYHGGGYELGEEYNWDAMPLDHYDQFDATQQQAVSHLMKDCGNLLQTVYSVAFGSGAAFRNAEKIKQYFNYDKAFTLCSAMDYTYDEWTSLLKKELDEGRPILSAGGLHAYVIDGYDDDGYFSINWGWGGHDNGYYIIDPYYDDSWGGDSIYQYFITQEAYIGLKPDAGGEYKYLLQWYAGDKYLSIQNNHYELSKPFELSNVFIQIRNPQSESGTYYYGDYVAAILNQSGEIKSFISNPQPLNSFTSSENITCQIDEAPNPGDYITILFRSKGTSTWERVLAHTYSNNARIYLNESERLDENTTITINPNERQFKRGNIDITTKLMTVKTMNGTSFAIYRSNGTLVDYIEDFNIGWLHVESDEDSTHSCIVHYIFLSNLEPGTYTIVLNHSLQHKEITFSL